MFLFLPLVLEKNPPKQGLKLGSLNRNLFLNDVLEKNPPKQGLKLSLSQTMFTQHISFREKSTKTRIETIISSVFKDLRQVVLEKNPPKQGLKQLTAGFYNNSANSVLEKNPPKQGLKHLRLDVFMVNIEF